MKPAKLIAALAIAVLCAFGVADARAQLVTNSVTLDILFIPQGPTRIVDGTNSIFVAEKTTSHNAAWFLQEIGTALHASEGASLSSAAKLVLLTGGKSGPLIAVIDGTNFYGLTNMMALLNPLQASVVSGEQNGGTGLAFPTLKSVQMIQLGFSDVNVLGIDNGLQFILQGLIDSSITDTAPAAGTGVYTQSVNAKLIDLVGSVTQSNNTFCATGTMSYAGKGMLVWQPK